MSPRYLFADLEEVQLQADVVTHLQLQSLEVGSVKPDAVLYGAAAPSIRSALAPEAVSGKVPWVSFRMKSMSRTMLLGINRAGMRANSPTQYLRAAQPPSDTIAHVLLPLNLQGAKVIIYNAAISACQRGFAWVEAVSLLASAEEHHVTPDIISYNATICATGQKDLAALEQRKLWQKALAILQSMEAWISLNSAISVCESATAWQQVAVEMLLAVSEMQALLLWLDVGDRGLKPTVIVLPNVVAYNASISACEKSEQWQRAVHLLEEMFLQQTQVDEISYNSAISACEKAGRWPQALQLLADALRQEVPIDIITINAAISSCGKCGQWRRGFHLLQEVQRLRLEADVVTFTAAMGACEKAAEWLQAICLLEEMDVGQIQPNVVTYNSAISACEKAAQWQHALVLLNSVESMHCLQPMLNVTLAIFAFAVISFSATISACEKASEWLQALHILCTMEAALVILADSLTQKLRGNVVVYNVAIAACGAEEQWELALGLLSHLCLCGPPPTAITFNSLIASCGRAFAWQWALQLLSEVELNELEPSMVTYSAALTVCEKARRWEDAAQVLHNLEDAVCSRLISFDPQLPDCRRDASERRLSTRRPSWRNPAALFQQALLYSELLALRSPRKSPGIPWMLNRRSRPPHTKDR
ncbi:Pentatricopeptide repeat-containing protein, chloroplastic [Symbiodinium microadriaticum]|uniref:Pentatricopeptide repeat-containing protein, chloroplastic n=1 Tax=Symbiodinium microadriaticum TaxID=2951 RepID=A0A1Q9D6K6_SYMMI|nr:Pentatricopeptide repeat-containing protein, chloroplastic [Symbiodinium microadriaticum]